MQLSSITDINFSENVNKVINNTSELLNKAISESRSLTYDLSPPILYELGLMATFKWKLEQVQKKHGISTILSGEKQKIEIQKEFNIFLYRIVSELITNVIKHANASLIELNIQKGKKYYYITVKDDGVGLKTQFDKKNMTKGGFGLLSIAERLDSIKGHFKIETVEEGGTKATVALPSKQ
jgi:signal transduction histidine kinase